MIPLPRIHARQTGTFIVDGLLEGPVGGDPALEGRLTDWIRLARTAGYGFSLEVEGDSFNLLGENRPNHVPEHIQEISDPLRDLLQQLVDSFAAEERGALFSTIRTVEYGEGVETQSLYAIEAGIVDVRQRTVDADTVAGEKPATGREKVRAAILAFLVLLAVFGISSIFVDWRSFATKAWRKIGRVDTERIEFVAGPYEPYLRMKELDTASDGKLLVLTLERGPEFPMTVGEVDDRLARPGLSLTARKVLESLASGYVRVELIGPDEKYQATMPARVTGLRTKETIEVRLLFSREDPPERLVLTW